MSPVDFQFCEESVRTSGLEPDVHAEQLISAMAPGIVMFVTSGTPTSQVPVSFTIGVGPDVELLRQREREIREGVARGVPLDDVIRGIQDRASS